LFYFASIAAGGLVMLSQRLYIALKNFNMNRNSPSLAGFLIGLGLVVLGWFIYGGISHYKDSERVVTVKGLAEKEVRANQVIWPLIYKVASNDLGFIYKRSQAATDIIIDFLINKGIDRKDITVAPINVNDAYANNYSATKVNFRYSSSVIVTVASNKVDLVRKIMSEQNELLSSGIGLSFDYAFQTEFKYTLLNDIKPGMIEEATSNARASAEKFAKDSDSKLGKIKTASQGQFSIYDRDRNTPYIKKVRVVTTIQYYLDD